MARAPRDIADEAIGRSIPRRMTLIRPAASGLRPQLILSSLCRAQRAPALEPRSAPLAPHMFSEASLRLGESRVVAGRAQRLASSMGHWLPKRAFERFTARSISCAGLRSLSRAATPMHIGRFADCRQAARGQRYVHAASLITL